MYTRAYVELRRLGCVMRVVRHTFAPDAWVNSESDTVPSLSLSSSRKNASKVPSATAHTHPQRGALSWHVGSLA
eukprot:COSAG01_NODE_35569_length_530_cov_0.740139_1_plen_73_part_10